jgi:integrase
MASPKKTSNGTWTIRYRDPSGHQHRETFTRRVEAEQRLRHVETAKDRGQFIDPADAKTRVDEWINDWHASRLNLRPSTETRDRIYIDRYIIPHLGRHQLGHLTHGHVRKWIATLNETLAPATTRKAHQLLRAALQAAVADRMIPTNVCEGTSLPALTDATHRYLTLPEVHDLANTIDERFKAFVYVGALAGLRPGELAALRLSNLDLRNQRLTITHTAVEQSGVITYGPPKTAAARRTIAAGQVLTGILTAHLDDFGPGSNVTHITGVTDTITSPLVFTASEGGPLRLTNLRRRQWRQAVEGSVGAPMRIHDLRHTSAALLISQGAHPKVIQSRLGHRDISTTMDVYGGLFHGYDDGVAEALDEAFTASL